MVAGLALCIAVVAALHRLGVPPVVGFILVGVLLGPSGLEFAGRTEQLETVSELGAILLLFGIGLELSLSKLGKSITRTLLGGAAQVAATGFVAGGGIDLLLRRGLDEAPGAGQAREPA